MSKINAWHKRPLGPYYTVGESLMCAAVFLIAVGAILAVWSSI